MSELLWRPLWRSALITLFCYAPAISGYWPALLSLWWCTFLLMADDAHEAMQRSVLEVLLKMRQSPSTLLLSSRWAAALYLRSKP